ncbi:MAG: L,D-transpeptidase [Lachnospiraceae bacterium]|nr:L,D-transpeptidase [Lachnospiraceae bacterium]
MPEEKKLSKRAIIIIISCIIALLAAFYLITAFYFSKRFLPNTWIGDVYCTGRSVDQVAADLKDKIEIPDIRISWMTEGYSDSYISSQDIGYVYDLERSVYNVKDSQNPFLWPKALFSKQILHLTPIISFDEGALQAAVEGLDRVRDERINAPVYEVRLDAEEGYYVYDTHFRRLDVDKVIASVRDNLNNGIFSLALDGSYFYDAPYSAEEQAEMEYWNELSEFLFTDLVYDMGAEKIAFDKSVMSFLIASDHNGPVRDENGDFILDDDAITRWIDNLCSKYDTYGLDRQFMSSSGRMVTIPAFYSTYGTELDHDAELSYLLKELHSDEVRDGEPDVHIPVYTHTATVRGLNDIGDTFIEVDLTDQYMYFYKDGELILETDIVSGDIPKGWTTPIGVFSVYSMATDQWLYGRDYIDFVSYWIAYFRGYGLHDSDWRDEWGGEIYTYDGSHGCINMDKEPARIVYENAEIGTPVIVYDY